VTKRQVKAQVRRTLEVRRTSLKAQLLVYGALSILIATALISGLGFWIAESNARREVQEHMRQTATALASALERVGLQEAQAILDAFHRASWSEEGHEALLVDSQGWVVASSRRESIGRPVEGAILALSGISHPASRAANRRGEPRAGRGTTRGNHDSCLSHSEQRDRRDCAVPPGDALHELEARR